MASEVKFKSRLLKIVGDFIDNKKWKGRRAGREGNKEMNNY